MLFGGQWKIATVHCAILSGDLEAIRNDLFDMWYAVSSPPRKLCRTTGKTEMTGSNYSVKQYVDDLRVIVREKIDEEKIIEKVRPLAKKLAGNRNWVTNKMWNCNEKQGFGVHLLHEEENHDLAVFVISWLPGRGTLAHNHKTWAVVVGMHGQEKETEWRRIDDGSQPGHARLECVGERIMTSGDVSSCMPEDIHTVWNVGDSISMSLHTYGRHINFTGRSEFDPNTNEERPLIVAIE